LPHGRRVGVGEGLVKRLLGGLGVIQLDAGHVLSLLRVSAQTYNA